MTGDRMFKAQILVRAPAHVQLADLRARLESLAGELMVDVSAAP